MNNELQSKFYKSIKDGNYLGSINIDVDKIGQGNFYTASKIFSAVANDGYALMRIKAGATKKPHVIANIMTTGKCYIKTYSGTTYTANGTEITPYNRNTTSSNVAEAKIYHTPTINVLGTARAEELVGSGTNPASQVGAVSSINSKTILANNGDILIQVQNKSGAAVDIGIVINFYEE